MIKLKKMCKIILDNLKHLFCMLLSQIELFFIRFFIFFKSIIILRFLYLFLKDLRQSILKIDFALFHDLICLDLFQFDKLL
jgi:hypothetical protein